MTPMLEWMILSFSVVTFLFAWLQERRFQRVMGELLCKQNELHDTWLVLLECKKVLNQHDDFNSRHVSNLIFDLLSKYPPKRNTDA